MRNRTVILLFFVIGCAVSKPHNKIKNNNKKAIEIVVKDLDTNRLSFNIINNTDSIIYLYEPQDIHIEKLVLDSWKKMRILPCPCDAPCRPPNEREKLNPNDSYYLFWSKEESWCGKERVKNVRNTVRQSAETGIYRIKINILLANRKIISVYQEFNIN